MNEAEEFRTMCSRFRPLVLAACLPMMGAALTACRDASQAKELAPGERVQVDSRRANQESFRYLADRVRRVEPGSAEGGLPDRAG